MNLPELATHAAYHFFKEHPAETIGLAVTTASFALPAAAVVGAIYGAYKLLSE